jgi:hypothetical protein
LPPSRKHVRDQSRLRAEAGTIRDKVSPAILPWWGWMVAAVVLWLIGFFIDEKRGFSHVVLFVGMVLFALIGVIRFVKWVWTE